MKAEYYQLGWNQLIDIFWASMAAEHRDLTKEESDLLDQKMIEKENAA